MPYDDDYDYAASENIITNNIISSGVPHELSIYWNQYPYTFGEAFCKIRSFLSERYKRRFMDTMKNGLCVTCSTQTMILFFPPIHILYELFIKGNKSESSLFAAPRTPQCWRSSRSPWSATSPSAPRSTSSPSQTSRGPPLSASSAGPSPSPPLSPTSSLLRSTISTYRIIQETLSVNLPSVRCLMKTSTPR